MATIKQRMWRKNASGTYDTIHLETESGLVLRPSGRTVEQDLTDYLPKTQDSDTPPETLKSGLLSTGLSLPFLGIGNKATRLAKYNEIPNLSNYYTKDEIDDKFENESSDDYSSCKFLSVNNVNARTGLSFSCNFRPLAIFGSSYIRSNDVYEWIEYIGTGTVGYCRLSSYSGDISYGSSRSYAINVNYSGNNVTISGFNTITSSRSFNLIVFG